MITLFSIDPGFKGGISIFEININNKNYSLVNVFEMPVKRSKTKRGKKIKTKVDIDINRLNEIFIKYKPNYVIVENVHALPKMNIQSMFRFGEQVGIIKGLSYALNIKIDFVNIKSWKKYFNLSSNKEAAVKLANNLFNLNLKKSQDGIAESLLIGKFYIETNLFI